MLNVAGLALFEGIAPWQFAALAAGYVLAFTVKGVFGYGAVPPMILIGSLLMPPHHAVLLAGLVNLASQGILVPDGLRHGDRRLAGRMIVVILPALVAGVFVFRALPAEGLQLTVGLLLLGILLLEGSAWHERLLPLVDRQRRAFGVAAAAIAGLMAGVVGAGAMIFLSLYLRSLLPERLAFRGTVILMVTAVLVFRTMLFAGAGLITPALIAEAAVMLPLAALCLLAGQALASRLSNDAYFRAYRAFMIVAALLLVARGLV